MRAFPEYASTLTIQTNCLGRFPGPGGSVLTGNCSFALLASGDMALGLTAPALSPFCMNAREGSLKEAIEALTISSSGM